MCNGLFLFLFLFFNTDMKNPILYIFYRENFVLYRASLFLSLYILLDQSGTFLVKCFAYVIRFPHDFQGKYTTKSDVWSFAVTLWEILTFARKTPYQELTNVEVMQNLSHMHQDNGLFAYLPRPPCPKDIFDLMLECWRRHEVERPSFREIHLFLQRKNLGYTPVV